MHVIFRIYIYKQASANSVLTFTGRWVILLFMPLQEQLEALWQCLRPSNMYLAHVCSKLTPQSGQSSDILIDPCRCGNKEHKKGQLSNSAGYGRDLVLVCSSKLEVHVSSCS